MHLSVSILIDSVNRKDKNYYPQVFFDEHKYIFKEKKMSKFITDNNKISCDGSDKEHSGEENSHEKNSDEDNSSKEN